MAVKKNKDKSKEESRKQKLAKKILKSKGIDFDTWVEEQYQKIIDENIELLINSLEIAMELDSEN